MRVVETYERMREAEKWEADKREMQRMREELLYSFQEMYRLT